MTLTHNEIQDLFYEKLNAVIDVAHRPVLAGGYQKLQDLPKILLQWISTDTSNWGGLGDHVLVDDMAFAITIIAKDRNTCEMIKEVIKSGLLEKGQIDVDKAATAMQLVFIRPGGWEYIYNEDDTISLTHTGTLVFSYT